MVGEVGGLIGVVSHTLLYLYIVHSYRWLHDWCVVPCIVCAPFDSGVNNAALGTTSQMSADGMTAVAGAPSGSLAYVLTRDHTGPRPSNWSVQGTLYYGDGTYTYMQFGTAVSINKNGTVVAMGGPQLSYNGTTSGMSRGIGDKRVVCGQELSPRWLLCRASTGREY